MADEAQKLLSQANETMSELQSAVTNLIAVLKTIQRGTARLPEITGALANESKDMEGIVRQTQTTMRELERSAEALQRHWLFRRYVNKTNPPPARPLPGREEQQKKPRKDLRFPKDVKMGR